MKTFTANYATEVARKRGAQPLWILSVTVAGVVYYLSDVVATIAGWNGGVTTLAWVSSWGELSEQMTGDLNEIRIADFSVTCLVDPDAAADINDLCAGDIEATPCRLWLWYRGLDATTDPPVCFFTGHVRDMSGDPYSVRLDLEDETYRLNGTIGTVATADQFPDIDPDDVGKLLPIVFGSVAKLPTLAIDAGPMTVLTSGMTAVTTSVTVSDATHINANDIIQIDEEQILVGTKSGNDLNGCTRGYNSTLPVAHNQGAAVLRYQSRFVYAIDGPVSAISKISGNIQGIQSPIDITEFATIYTGQVGDQLSGYGSKACVTFPDFIIDAGGSITLAGGVTVSDGITVSDVIFLNDAIALINNNSFTTMDPQPFPVNDLQSINRTSITDAYSVLPQVESYYISNPLWIYGLGSPSYATANQTGGFIKIVLDDRNFPLFPNNNFAVAHVIFQYGLWMTSGTGTARLRGYVNGTTLSDVTISNITATRGIVYSYLIVSLPIMVRPDNLFANQIQFWITDCTNGLNISDVAVSVKYVPLEQLARHIVQTGSYPRRGTVVNSGVLTFSGNTGANNMIADLILCDVTGLYTAPGDVATDLLSHAGYGAASVVGTVPTGYAINGAITAQGRLIDWLDSMAFQCRAFFRMVAGTGKLFIRPDTLTSARTISAIAVDGGSPLLTWSRAPLSQVINDITLRYGRDWQNSTGEPYLLTSADTDAASIALHGKQNRDNLFRCDWITGAPMADSVRAFYLAQCATRRTYVSIVVYLDQLCLEFGDVVTLPDGRVGVVVSVGIQPGSVDAMDRIKLTVMV